MTGPGPEVAPFDPRARPEVGTITETIGGTLDLLEQVGREGSAAWLVRTGFGELDDLLGGGLWPGHLVVLGGRAGAGTSTLALSLIRTAAEQHQVQTYAVMPDSTVDEVNLRLLAAVAQVPLSHLRAGVMSEDDWVRSTRMIGSLASIPLRVDTRPHLTIEDLESTIEREVEAGARLVVVDGLRALAPLAPPVDRDVEVSEQVRRLKRLARRLRVPIVVTALAATAREAGPHPVPQVRDLRGARGVEEEADLVVLLDREEVPQSRPADAGVADLVVAQHRWGPTRTITVAHLGRFCLLEDLARGA